MYIGMDVCTYGCVEVWVSECMGVLRYVYLSVWRYGCLNV